MEKNLNVKVISKYIKQHGKCNRVIWSKSDGVHFIGTAFWAFKLKEVPRDVLCALFSVFLSMPSENETLVCSRGEIRIDNGNPFIKVFDRYHQSGKNGVVTPFTQEMPAGNKGRIIDYSGQYIRINEEFFSMIKVYKMN